MTPEEPTPKPGIRYGGLMCPHGMVRGACAICRNPPPSPKPEAESVEPWKPEAERMAYEALNAAYLALRAEVERRRSDAQVDAVGLEFGKLAVKERDYERVVNARLRAELAEEKAAHSESFKQCDRISSALAASTTAHGKTLAELAAAKKAGQEEFDRAGENYRRAARAESQLDSSIVVLWKLREEAKTEIGKLRVRLRIAEGRVAELEDLLVRMQSAEAWTSGPWREASEAATAILAARSAKGGAK